MGRNEGAVVGEVGWGRAVTSPWLCPQRFLQDPYSTTFSSFSRVTNFFRGALQPHPEGASPDLHPAPDDEPEPGFEVISCVSVRVDPITFGCHLGHVTSFPRASVSFLGKWG